MGNTSSVPGSASGGSGHKFTPSDGFFLSESAAQGNVEVLGLFLAKNPALVWAVSSTDHSTPWHSAAERGHVDALQLLVNSLGQSPLMLACKQGHTQAVQLLLAHGSNLFLRDKAGATALHYAALHPAGGCVPLL
ncbi:putative E3 ubiquitin-protein ligase [Haematococcus lacustris]|uniref:Putative E3 ubiquitin-protein ligase n=1 Tax=Haematococcus lacustris TaxID=44745 RepID=A0A699ZY27_HAELA|nr:putative E3 ubiquitin-protein ligase [Haematococcus lacustris]